MNSLEQYDDSYAALRRAEMLEEMGRFAEAEPMLHQILAVEPENSHAWCILAHVQLELGRVEQSFASAKTAISIDPELEWPYRIASCACDRRGDVETSIALARESVRVAPHSAAGYVRLTYALAQSRNGRGEALAAANRALELAPHDPDSHLAFAAVAPNSRESVAACQRALELDPQNAEAHNDLAGVALTGSVFVRPAALADAASGFARALRADPRMRVARANLEIAMRNFLAQVSYAIILVAWVLLHLPSDMSPSTKHLVTAGGLVATILVIWDFVAHLTGSLREYLSRTLVSGWIVLVTGLTALAFVLLTASIFDPAGEGETLAYSALGVVIAGRIILELEFWRQKREIEAWSAGQG